MATKLICDRCGEEINPKSSVTYIGIRRHFLCHADCEEYERVRAERDAANARRYKEAEADALLKLGYQKRKENYRRGGLL